MNDQREFTIEQGTSNNKCGYGPKSKGRKPRSHQDRPTAKLEEIVTNKVEYWNKVAGFENVTKFNWPLIIGKEFNINDVFPQYYKPTSAHSGNMELPQIMVLTSLLGPGYAKTTQDGVNRGLSVMMSQIRSSLSTANIGFQTADLGIFLTTTNNIGAIIAYLKKLIAARNKWSPRNYAYPRGFYKAHGFDWDTETAAINTTIPRLNALIDQFNNMQLLDLSDIFDRQFALMHNVYLDEDSDYGQIYSFKPQNYYVYDDTKHQGTYYPVSGWTTFSAVLDSIQTMINGWLLSDDFYQINGVLHRAFKDHALLHIDHASTEDIITPTTDREILMQIMNCSIVNVQTESLTAIGTPEATVCITQDPSEPTYIKWTPRNESPQSKLPVVAENYLLRAFEDVLSQEDNMEMTRLLTMLDRDSIETVAGTQYMYYRQCGSDIITAIDMYYYDPKQTDITNIGHFTSNYISVTEPNIHKIVTSISNFRFIPMFFVYGETTGATPTISLKGLVGDVYNYMVYHNYDYQNLNNVAYQSAWLPKGL